MASTQIKFKNEADVNAQAQVIWGTSLIGQCTADPGGSCQVPCEWVWYDVYCNDASSGKELASKKGVYADSTVILSKEDGKYTLS